MQHKKLSLGLAAGALTLGGAFFAARPAMAQAFSNSGIGSMLSAPVLRGISGPFGSLGGGIGHHGPRLLIDATASVTGLTTQEIQTQLQRGKTLAQIAESKGKTADDVIASARTTLQTDLKQAVTDGKGHIVLDQTPLGDIAEIEGPARWIEATARRLSVAPSAYLTTTYADLFFTWKRETGSSATEMTFIAIGKVLH